MAVGVACAANDDAPAGPYADLGDLQGKTIGVTAIDSVATLELRYLLSASYGLSVTPAGNDVTLTASPADSLLDMMNSGDIDAAVLTERGAFEQQTNPNVYSVSQLAAETAKSTGSPVLATVLVTYDDTSAETSASMNELMRLLRESLTYFRANQDAVIDAVATDESDREFLRWWWDHQDLILGDASGDMQQQLQSIWGISQTLGDIDSYPPIEDVLFRSDAAPAKGTRSTITLALLDSPARRCALYALEQSLVTSDTLDVNLTYLPLSALNEALGARQYDVVEASTPSVPETDGLLVLSGGAQDLDGTALFALVSP